jgi:hypothetical protein
MGRMKCRIRIDEIEDDRVNNAKRLSHRHFNQEIILFVLIS